MGTRFLAIMVFSAGFSAAAPCVASESSSPLNHHGTSPRERGHSALDCTKWPNQLRLLNNREAAELNASEPDQRDDNSVLRRTSNREPVENPILIGVLFPAALPFGSSLLFAARLGASAINSNPHLLPHHRLEVIGLDSTLDIFQCQLAALELLSQHPVALLGPTLSDQAAVVSRVAQSLKVPVISQQATDTSLATGLDYPYFIGMIPGDNYQMQAIAAFVAYHQWSELVVVYMDDESFHNGVTSFARVLSHQKAWKAKIVAHCPLNPSASYAEVLARLRSVRTQPASVILVHAFFSLPGLIFQAAVELGMLSKGYVWLLTGMTASLFAEATTLTNVTNQMQGVVFFDAELPPSAALNAFDKQWLRARPLPGVSKSVQQPILPVLSTYDAVEALARALHPLLPTPSSSMPLVPYAFSRSATPHMGSLRESTRGPELRHGLLNVSFMGLTGRVSFSATGERTTRRITIWHVGHATDIKAVGIWDPDMGLLNSLGHPFKRAFNLEGSARRLVPDWPGGTQKVPSGWFPKSALTIAVPDKKGFNAFVKILPPSASDGTDGNGRFEGLCIEIFKAALPYLPYEMPYRFAAITNGSGSPSVTTMLNFVANRTFDGAVGDITVTASRSSLVSFTAPFIPSGLSLVTLPESHRLFWMAFRPFTLSAWLVVLLLCFLTAGVLLAVESSIFSGQHLLRQLSDALWATFLAVLGCPEMEVKSLLARVSMLGWYFISLILTTSYTANLISLITVQRLSSPQPDIRQFVNSPLHVGFQSGSFVQGYLLELGIPQSRLVSLNGEAAYIEALRTRRVAAIVDEDPYLAVFSATYCDVITAPQPFSTLNFAFAFPKGSKLADHLSVALLHVTMSTWSQKLQDRFLHNATIDRCPNPSTKLQVLDFLGLFVITLAAASVACVAYAAVMRAGRFLPQHWVVGNSGEQVTGNGSNEQQTSSQVRGHVGVDRQRSSSNGDSSSRGDSSSSGDSSSRGNSSGDSRSSGDPEADREVNLPKRQTSGYQRLTQLNQGRGTSQRWWVNVGPTWNGTHSLDTTPVNGFVASGMGAESGSRRMEDPPLGLCQPPRALGGSGPVGMGMGAAVRGPDEGTREQSGGAELKKLRGRGSDGAVNCDSSAASGEAEVQRPTGQVGSLRLALGQLEEAFQQGEDGTRANSTRSTASGGGRQGTCQGALKRPVPKKGHLWRQQASPRTSGWSN